MVEAFTNVTHADNASTVTVSSSQLTLRQSSQLELRGSPEKLGSPKRRRPGRRQRKRQGGYSPGQGMESWWKLFRFCCPATEAAFQQRRKHTTWSLAPSLLFMSVAGLLIEGGLMLWNGCPVGFMWPVIVSLVWCLALSGLLLVRPRLQKHTSSLIQISAVVAIGLQLLVVYLSADHWLQDTMERVATNTASVAGFRPQDDPVVATLNKFYEPEIAKEQTLHHATLCQLGFSLLFFAVGTITGYCKGMVFSMVATTIMSCVFFSLALQLQADVVVHLSLQGFVSTMLFPLVYSMFQSRVERREFATEVSLQSTMRASQVADSILNHTLKNTMADGAALVEDFLDESPEGLPAAFRTNLELTLAALWRGMRACRNRQLYISLVAGTYVPALREVNLQQFLSDLTKGRVVTLGAVVLTATFDPLLLALILDNALSNASKYGHPSGPDVRITVEDHTEEGFVFRVINRANPDRPPLTQDFVSSVFDGAGPKSTDALSNGVGLQHCLLAAQASSTTITLRQEEQLVIFEACIARPLDSVVSMSGAEQADSGVPTEEPVDLSEFPAGLVFTCIDDSQICLITMQSGLKRHAAPSRVGVYGKGGPRDVAIFLQDTLRDAHIAVMDYNLDFPGKLIKGVELVESLKADGFTGLMCIRSGNTSDTDIATYKASGCHCVVGKDVPISEAIATIKAAYLQLDPRPV